MKRVLPPNSVRGTIRRYIERHAEKLGDDVLEIGSRMTSPYTWWIVNRDLARGQWLGCDFQDGDGVDRVIDAHEMPEEWRGRFTGVLCSEVLEHVARPWLALPQIFNVMQPGGWIVVTTLTSFPVHGFPDDYYRYTTSGLRVLLHDAGFCEIEVENQGQWPVTINDHGESGGCQRVLPIHVFAVAQKPC